MAHSQNGNVIQMPLFQSIPSRPHAQGERAGYIFINILDPNYVFTPPETPAKCPQQQVSAPRMLSGDCLHMFTYPALLGISPAHPALPSGTLGMCTILPAQPKDHICDPKQPRQPRQGFFFWLVGNTRCGLMIWFHKSWVLIYQGTIYR
jgi:hypothetical protein